MNPSVYQINKGINKSIEFKGLKAQYIWYLAAGLVCLMVVFAVMYIAGVNGIICVVVVMTAGGFLFFKIYQMSAKYGEHGLKKKIATRALPKIIRCNSRKLFIKSES